MSRPPCKSAVTAFLAAASLFCAPVAQAEVGSENAARILEELSAAEDRTAANRLERELQLEWSQSGSAAMDLLLKRGRDALEVNDVERAIEHLSALTDHAPNFAEGWHMLAVAYFADERIGPSVYALERTLALNPDHFGALKGLGAIFDQVGDKLQAYNAYKRAAELRPHDPDLEEALDRLYVEARGVTL